MIGGDAHIRDGRQRLHRPSAVRRGCLSMVTRSARSCAARALSRRERARVPGDLSDGPRLSETIAAERPDCVLHLAAEIASQRSERKVATVNVEGTARLLDACRALAGSDPTAARGSCSPRPSSPAMHTARC